MAINPLQPIIPLTNGIDNLIIEGITNYFLSKPNITSAFGKNIYSYERLDLSSNSLPAIVIYPGSSETNSSSYLLQGYVKIDIVFPLNVVRENKLRSALNVGNAMYLQIKHDCMDFLRKTVYGLQRFAFKSSINYDTLYDDFANQSKISMTFYYDIDMTMYWNKLVSMGYDITSPDVVIYEALNDIVIDIKPQ